MTTEATRKKKNPLYKKNINFLDTDDLSVIYSKHWWN